jgi:hypothetical protein
VPDLLRRIADGSYVHYRIILLTLLADAEIGNGQSDQLAVPAASL